MESSETFNPTYHEMNRKRWQAASWEWARMHDERGTWRNAAADPALVFVSSEMNFLGDLRGKTACVLGSGDNLASFALAGLGAKVTSVDISQAQLDVAEKRADQLELNISFVQADVCKLPLSDAAFDLVYTGGHVAVWVSDLLRYYHEASRVLRSGGLIMINEYHPFRRVWKKSTDDLQVGYDYYERGPYQFNYDADILASGPGTYESFEFHWTISDFINAVIEAGCQIIHCAEFGDHVGDWEGAPMQGLPENFLLVGKKGE